MSAVPPGGPSTINGVVYQMLWALHTLGSFKPAATLSPDGKEVAHAILILEPAKGGDQQQVVGGKRVVVQLKARSDEGPWSLQDVIKEVLPDLYLAVDVSDPSAEYHFVTEGSLGDWLAVQTLFTSLETRPKAANVLDALNDDPAKPVRFRHSSRKSKKSNDPPFWEASPYTERKLFERIVSALRERAAIAADTVEQTRDKLWALLSRFRFRGGFTKEALQKDIDRWLLSQVSSADELPRVRDAMLFDLAALATRGSQSVEATPFFTKHGLTATPLTQWLEITVAAKNELNGSLARHRIDLTVDVRPQMADDLYGGWTSEKPVLVLAGAGGRGKTWLAGALLDRAASKGAACVLVEAQGDSSRDLAAAAAAVWQGILGHDNVIPFGNLRRRLRDLGDAHKDRELCVLVDGVTDATEGQRLVTDRWREWGVRLLVTCPIELASVIESAVSDRGRVVPVPDFSVEELEDYLEGAVGPHWPQIPADVRRTLRRPLLAHLYRESAGSSDWRPTREYELFERCWDDLVARRGVQPLDLPPLMKLCLTLLDGASYPWSATRGVDVGFSQPSLDRLSRAGWLQSPDLTSVEVWHDRLLNWSVAESLVDKVRTSPATEAEVVQVVAKLLIDPRVPCGRFLGYVPMDFLWIVLGMPALASMAEAAVDAMVASEPSRAHVLYESLLATLGPRVVPLLVQRLKAAAASGPGYLVRSIALAIADADGDGATKVATDLMRDTNPLIRRAGSQILALAPAAYAVDIAWEVHVAAEANSASFAWPNEIPRQWYEDTFGAVKACARRRPDWVEGAIRRADPAREPVSDLGYVVANLGDEGIWRRCKAELKAKMPPNRERSIATNILRYGDREEIAWLEPRTNTKDDYLGMTALRALIRLDLDKAFARLESASEGDLYFSRATIFAAILARAPERAYDFFFARLDSADRLWLYVKLFQGREWLYEVRVLDTLLDAFATILASEIATPDTRGVNPSIAIPLDLFLKAVSPPQLDCLSRRAGLPLERNLTAWLLGHTPPDNGWSDLDKYCGLRLLARIGHDGLGRVATRWLATANHHAKSRAVPFAARCHDLGTRGELIRNTQLDELWDGYPVLQNAAATALAERKEWRAVVAHILKWGLRTTDDVFAYRTDAGVLDNDILAEAVAGLRSGSTCPPGAVLAIGFGGRSDLLPEVREALRTAQPESDLALACAAVLTWLRDTDPSAVPLLRPLVGASRRLALIALDALVVNGSPDADEVVLEELRRFYDDRVSVAALRSTSLAPRAILIVQTYLRSFPAARRLEELGTLLRNVRSETVADVVSSPESREFIRDAAFATEGPFGGSRATAIRLLALFDPSAAIKAAQAALVDLDANSREQYVYVLSDLDRAKSVDHLLRHAEVEKTHRVIRAIGRALSHPEGVAAVRGRLASEAVPDRLTACRVAVSMAPDQEILQLLRQRLDDPDQQVAAAALTAFEAHQREAVAGELLTQFTRRTDPIARWAILDALLEVGDPGDQYQGRSWWVTALFSELTRGMRRHLSKELRDLQKNAGEAADKFDR